MVKLVAGVLHLRKLFQSVLPLKKEIECPIKFTPLNAHVNFLFPSGEAAVLAKFSPTYFLDFESDEEYFVVCQRLIECLKYSFRKDYNARFRTDLHSVHIDGVESGEHISSQLIPVKENMKKQPFQPIMTETGLMPTKEGKVLSLNVQARIFVEELVKNLPKGNREDEAGLSWDGETLKLSILSDSVLFERVLNPIKYFFQGEPIAVCLDWNTFQELAKQFVGEVWLGISKAGVVLSRQECSYSVTYLLGAERVDDEL